jgi:hypothetical protein
MGKRNDRRYQENNAPRYSGFGLAGLAAVLLAMASTACSASLPVKRPSEPLVAGEPAWPEDVTRQAERVDRMCGTRETQLVYDFQEAKQEQQKFKTVMGSITGGVGTVGGAIGGIGAFVIDSPDTMKTVTGITGMVSMGLGAVGSVVTLIVSPGAEKTERVSQSLATIEQKKAAARTALKGKDPSSWSDADKEAFAKAAKDLEAACK